jgi:pimeloyl-ACP methyl ester carboxylesterase
MQPFQNSALQELSGFGTVSGVPELPSGFSDIFKSYLVPSPGLGLHAVIGGNGPPLLLLGGWPQTWYAWRLVMPALAEQYTVIVIESRGVGRSDKPRDGYDSTTLAADIVAAMAMIGHKKFAMIGHDVGMWTAYAMACDFADSVTRLVVVDATIPGISPSPPLIANQKTNDFLWHINFNRALEVNELLVQGREEIYFSYQFAAKVANPTSISSAALKHYIDTLKDADALHASFEYFRNMDLIIEQSQLRRKRKLSIPVLAVGGACGVGARVEVDMHNVADDVIGVVIPDCGHFVQEEAPKELLAALEPFLRPWLLAFNNS